MRSSQIRRIAIRIAVADDLVHLLPDEPAPYIDFGEYVDWSKVVNLSKDLRALAAGLVHSADQKNSEEVLGDLESIRETFEEIKDKIGYTSN